MGKRRSRSLKYGKIAIVVFLTILIWVWADIELDETLPERSATIEVDESHSEAIWVSFSRESSRDIKVTLTGPHTAFVTLNRQLRDEGRRLTFSFDVEQEHLSEPGDHSLNVLDFLRKDKALRSLGIKVTECVPEFIDVNVVALVEKPLPVECFDENGQPVRVENIEPSTVTMFVPESVRTAQVRVSEAEIDRARSVAIEKMPYVVLAEGLTKQATDPVRIMIPSDQERLRDYDIAAATLAIALSPAMRGRYSAEVTNLTDLLLGRIAIRASEEAKRTYENQAIPHMTLYIYDDDKEEDSREVVYNFPEKFVREGEIELIVRPGQPARAKFKLIRLNGGESGTVGTE